MEARRCKRSNGDGLPLATCTSHKRFCRSRSRRQQRNAAPSEQTTRVEAIAPPPPKPADPCSSATAIGDPVRHRQRIRSPRATHSTIATVSPNRQMAIGGLWVIESIGGGLRLQSELDLDHAGRTIQLRNEKANFGRAGDVSAGPNHLIQGRLSWLDCNHRRSRQSCSQDSPVPRRLLGMPPARVPLQGDNARMLCQVVMFGSGNRKRRRRRRCRDDGVVPGRLTVAISACRFTSSDI